MYTFPNFYTHYVLHNVERRGSGIDARLYKLCHLCCVNSGSHSLAVNLNSTSISIVQRGEASGAHLFVPPTETPGRDNFRQFAVQRRSLDRQLAHPALDPSALPPHSDGVSNPTETLKLGVRLPLDTTCHRLWDHEKW